MADIRCCRFHKWFVILLVLAVWSLVSHFFVDLLPFQPEQGINLQVQQNRDNRLNNQEVGHATGLHGGFMLAKVPAFVSPETHLTAGEIPDPLELAWIPPTPFRPPITR